MVLEWLDVEKKEEVEEGWKMIVIDCAGQDIV